MMSAVQKKLHAIPICLLLAGCILLNAPIVYAQDVSVEAEVSSRTVPLNSAIQFTITIHGAQDVEPIQLPPVEGFQTKFMGPSTRVSIINGQYSSAKSFLYNLYPQKVGQFKIPEIDIIIKGKTYKLQELPVEVVATSGQIPQSGQNQPLNLKDQIFIKLKVPKNEIFLNEPLPVKVLMFIVGLSVRDIQLPQFDNIGFTLDDFEKPQQYQQVVQGIRYNVIEFDTKLYPSRSGEITLGPAKVECNIIVQSVQQPSRLGQGGSVFDDDFFNAFFTRQEKRPMTLESDATTLNVLPLPRDVQPEDFSGAVGQYSFNVNISPNEVNVGDPITMRMTVIGKGNLASIQLPTLPSSSEFKLYDPQIFEKDNIKKSEQVIIPLSPELKEVPALKFSYFDPELKTYRTITQGPFPITVNELKKGDEFKVIGLEGDYKPVIAEVLGQDIVYIKAKPGKWSRKGEHLYNSGIFIFLVIFTVGVETAAYLYFRRTKRIKSDVIYARRLLAPRQAKKNLAEVKSYIASNQTAQFYDAVFKTIQHYLGNKLHLSSGAVTFETVRPKLEERNVDGSIVNEVKLIFEECDQVRYAMAGIKAEDMGRSYGRLTRVIDHCERRLK